MSNIHFEELNMAVPEIIYTFPVEVQHEVYKYIEQMDETHRKAYLIAKEHLGSSFNICKSNGYKEWKKNEK